MKIARVIDYETTGFPEDAGAEIIEMGRIDVDIEAMEVLPATAWRSFVHPRGPISPIARAVHHITDADVADAPQARDLWDDFFAGADVLVAHVARFEQHFTPDNGRPWIDTYKIARVIWPDLAGFKNQELRYLLGLDLDPTLATPPHRSLPDAYVTAHLLARLLEHKTVEEMIHISKYPALLKIMNFGKHKGMTFEAAPFDYLEWIRDKSEMDEDTKFTARYWMAKRVRSAA